MALSGRFVKNSGSLSFVALPFKQRLGDLGGDFSGDAAAVPGGGDGGFHGGNLRLGDFRKLLKRGPMQLLADELVRVLKPQPARVASRHGAGHCGSCSQARDSRPSRQR